MQQVDKMTKKQLMDELSAAKKLIREQAQRIEKLYDHGEKKISSKLEQQITVQKRIKKNVMGCDNRFKNCVDNLNGRLAFFSAVRNEKGRVVDLICDFVNKATCHALQMTKEEIIGKCIREVWTEMKSEIFNACLRVCETGETYSNENLHYPSILQKDHIEIFKMEAFKVGDGIGISVRDITSKRKCEKELNNRQKKFEILFNNNIAAMSVVNFKDWQHIDVNPAWERMSGYSREEAIGRSMVELGLVDPQTLSYKEKRAIIKAKGFSVGEHDYTSKSGEIRKVIYSIVALEDSGEKSHLCTFIDITEQRLMEVEMSRLDRLNIVGEMAAGIGHEIRNPMTTVRGYLQLFQRKKTFSEYYRQLETMIEELDRANLIISEFLSLAKNKTMDMKPANINNIISHLFPLFQAEAFRMGHEIEVQAQEVPDIKLDEREVRQMLHNLVRNGLEAMPQCGKITIKTYWDGEKIILSVRDMGTGIPSHIMERLGIPFVTTKEKGTGLGLSVCYRIAQRHNAKIDVKTSSKGTEFTLSFEKIQVVPMSLW